MVSVEGGGKWERGSGKQQLVQGGGGSDGEVEVGADRQQRRAGEWESEGVVSAGGGSGKQQTVRGATLTVFFTHLEVWRMIEAISFGFSQRSNDICGLLLTTLEK